MCQDHTLDGVQFEINAHCDLLGYEGHQESLGPLLSVEKILCLVFLFSKSCLLLPLPLPQSSPFPTTLSNKLHGKLICLVTSMH